MAGKFNLAVSALRWGEDIHATVQALFPDGQHRAEITDIYPGGAIVYANDPGEAQIFVKVSRTGAGESGGPAWEDSRAIPHCRFHQDLAVIAEFEGRTFIARTRIHRFRNGRAPAMADPAALRRVAGLPPAASVGMASAALARPPASMPAPVRHSNCPTPPLSA